MTVAPGKDEEDAAVRFLRWLRDNGASFPKLKWPVTTPNGLRGAVALDPIASGETMLSIPRRLMISEETCWADASLRRVYAENRDVFARDDPVLALFLVREMAKGSASFYFPYLSILPEVETVQDWSPAELDELRDSTLVDAAARRTTEMEAYYRRIKQRLQDKYQDEMPVEDFTFKRFRFAWKTIQARTFGRRLPWTALVPFADCLNHSNVATKYDFDVDGSNAFRLFPSSNNNYSQGCEVFNSYGRRPNFQLLLDYGFVLDDNEWDFVDVELPRDTTQAVGRRFAFRKRLRLERHTTLEMIFPMAAFPATRPDGLADVEVGEKVTRCDVLQWFRHVLGDAASRFRTTAADDERQLRTTLPERTRIAIVFRLSRLKILDAMMNSVERELDASTLHEEDFACEVASRLHIE